MIKVKVKMLETARGANNITDFIVRTYEKGETYDLSPDLASSFIGRKVAKKVGVSKPKPSENKADKKDKTENK